MPPEKQEEVEHEQTCLLCTAPVDEIWVRYDAFRQFNESIDFQLLQLERRLSRRRRAGA